MHAERENKDEVLGAIAGQVLTLFTHTRLRRMQYTCLGALYFSLSIQDNWKTEC